MTDTRTYQIIGAAMAVHPQLGCGFLEAAYQDALEIQFKKAGIPFEREVPFAIPFEGQILASTYHVDFVCFGEVIVELKAHGGLGQVDWAQTINYLKASGLQTAVLLNFGLKSLQFRRFIWTPKQHNLRNAGASATAATPEAGAVA